MSLTQQLFLQSLRELDGVSQNVFDKHRGPLIASLIDHAWREVPAYRARLAPFVVDGNFDLSRWVEIPLLRCNDLNALGPAFVARSVPPPDMVENIDLASQVPVARRSQLSRIATECERERFYETLGIELTAQLAILHPEQETSGRGRGWSITFTGNNWSAGSVAASPSDQLDWLTITEIHQLRTNSVLADGLAKVALERASKVSLDAVIIADDLIPIGLAAKIERAFCARIIHFVERPMLGVLAACCGSNDYAVPSGTNIVEVVDQVGLPVRPGEIGELVVSPLYEFATPLLRFATEINAVMPDDAGTILGVRRLCGINGLCT